jgi:hypothetical protein
MGLRRYLLLLAVFLFACAGASTSGADAPRMNKDELKALLGKPDVVVIDVRAGGDWASSDEKIAGAVREDPTDVGSWAGKYPKDKTLVLYCA